MAQDGDTITYTFDGDTDGDANLKAEQEDVSSVDIATVDYCDGAGGGGSSGGNGGRVESAEIDVSNEDTLYIWVAETGKEFETTALGRYDGKSVDRRDFVGGGSTEISFSNTDQSDSKDEPFLVGAGGGGSDYTGARGGSGSLSEGTPPPAGGTSGGGDGDGAIDDQNRGLVSGGTTITGGGSGSATNGEVQISYQSALSPPTNVRISDASTEDQLTLDWDEVSNASSYNVYRAQSSGSTKSDYTLIAEPTSPPFTDTGLEDGERYYYRVTSEN